ncbi:MAG: phenylacetate--CoA ligase family protein [Bilophila wadsworthia]
MGELVLTTLCRHGMPILRYRTAISPGSSRRPSCGRHRRIDRHPWPPDDMIIVKGVNIYPMQVERVLMAYPEVGQNYVIVLERDGLRTPWYRSKSARRALWKTCAARPQETIARASRTKSSTPKVELVQHNSLPRTEGGKTRHRQAREELRKGVEGGGGRNFRESPPLKSPLQRLSYLSNPS